MGTRRAVAPCVRGKLIPRKKRLNFGQRESYIGEEMFVAARPRWHLTSRVEKLKKGPAPGVRWFGEIMAVPG